jgi:large subunit ribosomal protein L22
MAFGVKTNEGGRPGTRAQVRYVRVSAYKAREVLDLIRGKDVQEAIDILKFCERDPAIVVGKCLASAVANATNNDGQDPDELFVLACYADEGPTLKRWRPRARGRATRIRKRTCHITVIVSRLADDALERRRQREAASPTARATRRAGRAAAEARRERVARSRRRQEAAHEHDHDHEHDLAEEPEADADAEVEAPEVDDTTKADAEKATEDTTEDTADATDDAAEQDEEK